MIGSSLMLSVHFEVDANDLAVPGSILMLLKTLDGSILIVSVLELSFQAGNLGRTRPVDEGTTNDAIDVDFLLSGLLMRVRASWSLDDEGALGGGGGGGGGEGGDSSRMPPSSSLVRRSKKFSSKEGSIQSMPRSAGPKFEKPEAKSSACCTGCCGSNGTKSNFRSSAVND